MFIPAADLSLTSATVSLNKTSYDLAEARCKNYYQLFNNYSCTVSSGIKKWQEKFPEIFDHWLKAPISSKFLFSYLILFLSQ